MLNAVSNLEINEVNKCGCEGAVPEDFSFIFGAPSMWVGSGLREGWSGNPFCETKWSKKIGVRARPLRGICAGEQRARHNYLYEVLHV
jgi:hypothetical protein